jgi:D-alanyl-D-alanine dipeptidase
LEFLKSQIFTFAILVLVTLSGAALAAPTPTPTATPGPELVNVKTVDPTIEVELRYATPQNVTGRALYPPRMPALLRPSVAARLAVAQSYLQVRGFKLKIWDAYRPKVAHDQLWQLLPNSDFVANPTDGGSLHTWGVAVDATLVYANGHAVEMPTDFDEFTPAAMLRYTGTNGMVRDHLHMLQRAMASAGFYGMRTEWWHFVSKDWQKYRSVDAAKTSAAR